MSTSTEKNIRIKQKVDTKNNWEQSVAILLKDEIAFCSDNSLIKKGDGIHTWKELPYFSVGALDNNGAILTGYDTNKIYSSESLVAGKECSAGRKGFYITTILWDATANTTTLTLEETEDFNLLAVNDSISIGRPFQGNVSSWEEANDVATIIELNKTNYTLKVNGDIGLREEYLLEYYPDEPETLAKDRRVQRKLWINKKPQLGNYETALRCFSSGRQNQASGDCSMAFGRKAKAYGNYSLAVNENTIANGASSVALNRLTTANGKASLATGWKTIANGDGSFATGNGTTTSNDYETAIGINNITKPNQIFSIGVGSDNNKNALEVTKAGTTTIYDLVAPGFIADKAKELEMVQTIEAQEGSVGWIKFMEIPFKTGYYNHSLSFVIEQSYVGDKFVTGFSLSLCGAGSDYHSSAGVDFTQINGKPIISNIGYTKDSTNKLEFYIKKDRYSRFNIYYVFDNETNKVLNTSYSLESTAPSGLILANYPTVIKAKQDQLGREINTTYATKTELSTLEKQLDIGSYKGIVDNFTDLFGTYQIGDIYKVKNKYWEAPKYLQYDYSIYFNNFNFNVNTTSYTLSGLDFNQLSETEFIVFTTIGNKVTWKFECIKNNISSIYELTGDITNFSLENQSITLTNDSLGPYAFTTNSYDSVPSVTWEASSKELINYTYIGENSFVIFNGTEFIPLIDETLPYDELNYYIAGDDSFTFKEAHIIPVQLKNASTQEVLDTLFVNKKLEIYATLTDFFNQFNKLSYYQYYTSTLNKKTVHLLGQFNVTLPITISTLAPLNIIGHNAHIKSLLSVSTSTTTSNFTGPLYIKQANGVTIENIDLFCTKEWSLNSQRESTPTCNSNINGIYINNSSDIKIQNCSIYNFPGSGICTYKTCTNIQFINLKIFENRNNGIIFNPQPSEDSITKKVQIKDCYFKDTSGLIVDHQNSSTATVYNTISLNGSMSMIRIINCINGDLSTDLMLSDDGKITTTSNEGHSTKAIIRKQSTYVNNDLNVFGTRSDVFLDEQSSIDFRLL